TLTLKGTGMIYLLFQLVITLFLEGSHHHPSSGSSGLLFLQKGQPAIAWAGITSVTVLLPCAPL
ncbi:hypothetical protein ACFLVS_07175, partial [Chloroflexota bacterium]